MDKVLWLSFSQLEAEKAGEASTGDGVTVTGAENLHHLT
jgi:hypothetical protein